MNNTMRTYIEKEQDVIMSVINDRCDNLMNFIEFIKNKEKKTWYVLSAGSSYNAVLSVKNYLERTCKIKVKVLSNYDEIYYSTEDYEDGVLIAISQSGSSTSTFRALDMSDQPAVVLTSQINSLITSKGDVVVDLGIGTETVGYVTLGFTATMVTLILMGLEQALIHGYISYTTYEREIQKLRNTVSQIDDVIKLTDKWFLLNSEVMKNTNHFVVVGSGSTYGLSKEFDTKFTETVRVPVNSRELDEYMHGPYLQSNNNQTMFLLQTGFKQVDEELLKLRNYISKFNEHIYTLSVSEERILSEKELSFGVQCDPLLSPILMVIPIQIYAYEIAEQIDSEYMSDKFSDFGKYMNSKRK